MSTVEKKFYKEILCITRNLRNSIPANRSGDPCIYGITLPFTEDMNGWRKGDNDEG
jgi:hypothetical protein